MKCQEMKYHVENARNQGSFSLYEPRQLLYHFSDYLFGGD